MRARIARAPAAAPSPGPGQRAYAVGLDALAGARPSLADAAQPTGWQFLIGPGAEPDAAAEVHDSHRAAVPAQVTRGPLVQSAASGLAGAEALPAVREATFEPRLLRVPALNLSAIWLHTGERDDLVVPLEPAPPPLEAGHAYSEHEFVEVVSDMAQTMRDQHNAAERPGELGS
jgi:hypothetical protein